MSRITASLLFLISVLAGWTLWYATPAGLGLTNDSAAYIAGARSLLAESGYSDIWLDSVLEPITHYPPLLSLSLSAPGLLGLDPYRGARLLNILLWAASSGLIGWLGWRMTRSQSAAVLLALLFALNAHLLRVYAYVLSEPLFLFLSLAAFLTFERALERPSTKGQEAWLLLTGGLTGLAFLTRYSGLALIATCLAALFILQPTWRSRLVKIGQFLIGALPPIAAWFVRNALVAETATNRTFQYHPIQIRNIRVGLYNIADFLSPLPTGRDWLFQSGALAWMLAALGLFLLGWLLYRTYRFFSAQAPIPTLVFSNALYVYAYLGAILFSLSFFDASTKFQPRILAPLYVSGLILFVYGLQHLRGRPRIFPILGLGLALIGLAGSTLQFQAALPDLRDSAGLGYASWRWRQSPIMARLKDLPPGVAIYTNSPPAVYHVTGRASRVLPSSINPVSGQPREGYQQDLAHLREELLAGRAVLALFDTTDIEDALGVDDLSAFSSGLTVLEQAQGSVLYGKP